MDGWAGCASGGENGHRQAHNHPGGGGPDKCRSVHSDSSPHRCFQLMRLFYAGMPFGDRRVFYPDVSALEVRVSGCLPQTHTGWQNPRKSNVRPLSSHSVFAIIKYYLQYRERGVLS